MKITNKQRDSAMSHLLSRMDANERMCYTALDLLENYIIHKDGSKEKFTKWLENKHKEAVKNEKKELRQKDKPVNIKLKGDKGPGTKGIRKK